MVKILRSYSIILFNIPEQYNQNNLENIKSIFSDLNKNILNFIFFRLEKIKSTIPDKLRPAKINFTDQSDIFTILRV